MTLSAFAQGAPAEPPAEAEISNFTLDNGLEVVVIPDRRAPIVTHMLWYKIGSADEPAGKSGIAHFLEHLMFKGTEKHPAGEMDRTIAEVGGYTNAFTTKDVTVYLQTVPPDMLSSMMDFEADRMRGLVLPEEVIDAERDVILEERNQRIEGSPQALLAEESAATLYQNHPYRVPVIGWLHEMEQLSRADALDFYHRYYAPNNAVLVVAGDVDADEVRSMAEATYGKVERGPDLPPRIRPSEPHQDTARTVTLSDPRVGIPSFTRGWLTPTYRTAENGEAEALDLLSEILGGGSRSRFYQEIVVKQGLASAAGAGYDGGSYDPSNFTVYGAPQGEHTLDEVEAAVTAQVQRLIDDGVTPEELDAAKMRYVRGLIFARDEQSNMANIYGSRLANDGTVEDVEQWPDRIRAVTPEQIQAVAKKYLDPDVSVTGYLLPSENGAQ
ncbi:MAG: pitrilysin family protein [Candidatus Devosia phytovorans]|uniref:Pitrilysin family protein n=1 Tax=Candidatus Devosia phytovorans TaxID=3121372 RepID=A0AAJ5W080_9HYPH|nr:pitrilysin family protein [Devosia sp.]WEK06724.1 MAG: pitrilysin family protein [Devosia sp.]